MNDIKPPNLESEGKKLSKSILTKREKEVFELLILNKTTREIAEKLNISEKTVRNHISNAMQKLGVKGRAGAVVELLKLNEISL
jgi:LuxR family transcriptional regulator of spore coat protein